MELQPLKQRHLEAYTRALRGMKPEGIDSVLRLPQVEVNGLAVRAALEAGWFVGDDIPDNPLEWVGDQSFATIEKHASAVWEAWAEATNINDPNS